MQEDQGSSQGLGQDQCGERDEPAVGSTAALAGQTKGEPEAPQRWQRMDRTGLIETARAWADRQMVEHDTRTDLAQSLRDAAFYRADALYEFAAHIEDGNFDAVRPAK